MAGNIQLALNPLVSIIIPAYNAGPYIAETIKSAMAQTWHYKEIIIIDDGSTDNTLSIAKSFENEWVKVISQANNGAASARNRGLTEAKGHYIQFLDADDLLSVDKIERQLEVLQHSTTQLAFCRTVHFKDGEEHQNGKLVQSWLDQDMNDPVDFLIKLYADKEVMPEYGGMVSVHAWLTPAAIIEKAGRWNEALSVDDDGEFFCRVVLSSAGIKFSQRATCYYRKYSHGGSLSAQKDLNAVTSALLAIDLKYKHLKQQLTDNIVDRVLARHYWEVGLLAYPKFKELSASAINTAFKLGYNSKQYPGGPKSQLIAKVLGWKTARLLTHYLC